MACLALLLLLALPSRPQTQTSHGLITLNTARVVLTIDGRRTEQAVTLPYRWDANNRGAQGDAIFMVDFELPALPRDGFALEIPKLGNAYEIRLNGLMMDRRGELDQHNGADYSHLPRFIPITQGLLQNTNQLEIHVRADIGRQSGLSPILLGPHQAMRDDFEYRYFWTSTGTAIVSAFSLGIGLLCLGLWISQASLGGGADQRHQQAMYLFAAMAALIWSFGAGYTLVNRPPIPWPWWGVLWCVSVGAWVASMMMFYVEAAHWRDSNAARRLRYWIVALLLSCPVMAYLALGAGWPLALSLWYGALLVTCVAFSGLYFVYTVRRRSIEHWVASISILLNLAAGVRDVYVFRLTAEYGQVTWLRYTSVAFGLTLGYLVIARFRSASAQARDLMQTLSDRVAQREQALETSYRRMEQLARQQERVAERSSILRDMHDGVGAHIAMAIRHLESGHTSGDVLLPTLRDSLDQLKLTIDTMNLPPGDVAGLLANLRYRLGSRIEASGIELDWQVGAFEPIERLDVPAIRQLMFVFFETISNVLQHSRASHLRIEALEADGKIRVRFVDDGIGFDAAAPWSNGLVSMRARAAAIGAQFNIRSAPGRTEVEVLIARHDA